MIVFKVNIFQNDGLEGFKYFLIEFDVVDGFWVGVDGEFVLVGGEFILVLDPQPLSILTFVILKEFIDFTLEHENNMVSFFKLMIKVFTFQVANECHFFLILLDVGQLHELTVHLKSDFIAHMYLLYIDHEMLDQMFREFPAVTNN